MFVSRLWRSSKEPVSSWKIYWQRIRYKLLKRITSKPFNFAIPFNYSIIRTPQGLHHTMPTNYGAEKAHNQIRQTMVFEVSI